MMQTTSTLSCEGIGSSTENTDCDTPGSCGFKTMYQYEFYDVGTKTWKPLCAEWFNATQQQALFLYLSIGIVVFINLGLK